MELCLDIPQLTHDVMLRLARLTGVTGDDWRAQIIQDALRTYSLIADQQAAGYEVIFVRDDDKARLVNLVASKEGK